MIDISYSFRIGHTTVSKLILECYTVLWDTLEKIVTKKQQYIICLDSTFIGAALI